MRTDQFQYIFSLTNTQCYFSKRNLVSQSSIIRNVQIRFLAIYRLKYGNVVVPNRHLMLELRLILSFYAKPFLAPQLTHNWKYVEY